MLEVELRALLSDHDFERIRTQLGTAQPIRQITYYLDSPVDTRIQLSSHGGKVWQKLGKIHEDAREEVEVPLSSENAKRMLHLFQNMGFAIKVAWFRERRSYVRDGITIALDNTVGYGKSSKSSCRPILLPFLMREIG